MKPPGDPLAALLARLDVRPLGADTFRGELEDEEGRPFGGELIAQAAVAAARTVEGATLHSLHAYFLRSGRARPAARHHVERLRDGRTFRSRRVRVEQHGQVLCDVTLSFVAAGEGPSHQDGAMPDVPPPEKLPDADELARLNGWPPPPAFPTDWRHVEPPGSKPAEGEPFVSNIWMRPTGPMPDDPLIHAAMIIYYSDAGAFGALHGRYGELDWRRSASLDHAVWLHRPVRWDDWMLVSTESPAAHDGRALIQRRLYTREGELVASVAQEALFRERPPGEPSQSPPWG